MLISKHLDFSKFHTVAWGRRKLLNLLRTDYSEDLTSKNYHPLEKSFTLLCKSKLFSVSKCFTFYPERDS